MFSKSLIPGEVVSIPLIFVLWMVFFPVSVYAFLDDLPVPEDLPSLPFNGDGDEVGTTSMHVHIFYAPEPEETSLVANGTDPVAWINDKMKFEMESVRWEKDGPARLACAALFPSSSQVSAHINSPGARSSRHGTTSTCC